MPRVPSLQHAAQHRRLVGQDAVDTEVQQSVHLAGFVDRPHVDLHLADNLATDVNGQPAPLTGRYTASEFVKADIASAGMAVWFFRICDLLALIAAGYFFGLRGAISASVPTTTGEDEHHATPQIL